jgi:hypothetical protein
VTFVIHEIGYCWNVASECQQMHIGTLFPIVGNKLEPIRGQFRKFFIDGKQKGIQIRRLFCSVGDHDGV